MKTEKPGDVALMRRGAAGFSLIEVMVATAIFLLIVGLIGGVFRQASSAWESGYAQANGGMIVRGVVGSIQRELSEAVDGRQFPGAWTYADPIKVQNNSIEFICLKSGTNGLHLVEYRWGSSAMTRKDSPLVERGGKWTPGSATTTTLYEEPPNAMYSANFKFSIASKTGNPVASPRTYEVTDPYATDPSAPTFSSDIYWSIPAVSIVTELTRVGSFSGLEVRSYGRNGVPDTDATGKNDDLIAN